MNDDGTLIEGCFYDVKCLVAIGWTDGDGSGAELYQWIDYFEPTGEYKGPDCFGIEPIFELLPWLHD